MTDLLRGRRVATTRDEPGRLDALLAELGAEVVHVPLIEIVDAPDPGLQPALADLDAFDWIVVTSRHGADRVAPALAGHPTIRTAAVGSRTAAVLHEATGRPVTVVPARQTAADLVDAMPEPDLSRVLVAQADRADDTLSVGLTARGYDVTTVTAYVTRLRTPTDEERRLLDTVDVVAFASGSAAQAWADAIGTWTPPHVVAIGPTTASVATAAGLQVTAIAADHSVEGLAAAVTEALTDRP